MYIEQFCDFQSSSIEISTDLYTFMVIPSLTSDWFTKLCKSYSTSHSFMQLICATNSGILERNGMPWWSDMYYTCAIYYIIKFHSIEKYVLYLCSGRSKGVPQCMLLTAQKFLNFMQFILEIWQNCMLVPPGRLVPLPMGNSRFTPALKIFFQKQIFCEYLLNFEVS